jgi:hypothetical protein
MSDQPLPALLSQAKRNSHSVAKRLSIWERPSALEQTEGEPNINSRADRQVFQLKLHFALRIWLPLVPALTVLRRRLVSQGRQNIKNHKVIQMIGKHIVMPTLPRGLGPVLNDFMYRRFLRLHVSAIPVRE